MKSHISLSALMLLSLSCTKPLSDIDKEGKPSNVLFIIVDDLRPELGCYNSPIIKTPNIDRLATQGVLFTNAYCNIPVSGASRTSLLTGLRPTRSTIRNWDASTADVPNAIPINQCFRKAGYKTVANGKVFHHSYDQADDWDILRDLSSFAKKGENSWYYHLDLNNEFIKMNERGDSPLRGNYAEGAECPESDYIDYRVASQTIDDLRKLSKSDEPFFLACGFIKPHLPFVAPQKYFDMYDPSMIELPNNWKLREGHNIPSGARKGVGGEMMKYRGISRKRERSREETQEIIRGYYACVSHIDAQIGRILDELESLDLDQNTTVVLIGDHGWNLAEHGGMFCKQTILYHAIRSTLIMRIPGALKGHRSNEVVEFVDLYPTLCEITGIEPPTHLQGESIKPLCSNVEAESKGYAVARWYDGWTYTDGRYYYGEWYNEEGDIKERLLFDHSNGIDDNYNLVDKPHYKKIVEGLQKQYYKNRGESWDL